MRALLERAFQDELTKLAAEADGRRVFADVFLDEVEKLGLDKKAFLPLIPLVGGILATTGGMAGLGALMKPKGQSWGSWMPASSFGEALKHNTEIGSYLYGGGMLARGAGAGVKALRAAGTAAKTPGLLGRAGRFMGNMFKDTMVGGAITGAGEAAANATAPAMSMPRYTPQTISGMQMPGSF